MPKATAVLQQPHTVMHNIIIKNDSIVQVTLEFLKFLYFEFFLYFVLVRRNIVLTLTMYLERNTFVVFDSIFIQGVHSILKPYNSDFQNHVFFPLNAISAAY